MEDTRINHWIDGKPLPPSSNEWVQCYDPSTNDPTVSVAAGNSVDVDAAVDAAQRARSAWRHYPALDRMRLLRALSDAIRADADRLAVLESQDTGKPRSTALSEISTAATFFEYYSGLVNLPLGDTLDVEPNQHVYTKREPYGIVGIITPWNLPLNQAARALAPALVAGNVAILKPSEVTSQTSVALAQLATQVGIPDGVINVVLGSGPEVGMAIVQHALVRKVAFTGSVAVGRRIGHAAADKLMPLTLELGGKSANIVFADADLDFAATEAVRAFTANSGQVCSAGSRLFIHRSVYGKLLEEVVKQASRLTPGTDLGPIITAKQFEQVKSYFDLADEEGATTLLGGRTAESSSARGYYISPTIYSDVDNSMRIAQEEIFGPVLVGIPFDTEEEAIRMANDSSFGLVAAVWTRDISRALRLADQLEAGQVSINTWATGAVQTPFGGHKDSGYGREKGIEAILHYSHSKTVVVAL